MSKTPPTASSSSTLDDIMKDLREQYEKNESLRPFIKKLEGKSTAAEISAIFRDQVKEYDSASYDKLMKSLNPIVNVLCASSSVIGAGVGLVFKPASVIFAGANVLLSAANGVIASYNALIVIFEDIGNFFHRLEKNTEKATMEAIKDIIAQTMDEVFKIFAFMTKEVKLGRAKRFFRTLSRNLIGSDFIKGALNKLDRLTEEGVRRVIEHVSNTVDRVEGSLGALNNNLNQFIKDNQEWKASEDEEKKRQKIEESRRRDKKWLSPPDPSTNQNKHIASQAQRESSATWIFEENIFMEWNLWGSKSTTSLLWIHGKPGSGKSVLSSAIIEDITALQPDGLATMAYFYFVYNDLDKRTLDKALRSLLTQLSACSDSYCDILSRVYKECSDGTYQPSTKKMVECLKEMLALPNQRPVYIILDALDECPNTSGVPPSRKEVLDLLKDLVDLRLSHLHICVTSRREDDIETALTRLTIHSISIQDQYGQKMDIEDYIKFVVYAESDMAMGRWSDQERELVIKALADKADGMFQWVFCQLEVLQDCDPEVISQTLNDLPDSLDGTYERMLEEIEKANQRHRLGDRPLRFLQCIAMAIRPLRVEELTEILALDFSGAEGTIPKVTKASRSENRLPRVLSTCSSLVKIVDNGDSRVIQFSHFSVKEYLTSDRLDVSHFHITAEPAHTTLAQACLGTLLQLDGTLDKYQVERSFPLATYASVHWVDHAQFGTVSSRIEDGMRRLFDSAIPHFAAWLELHNMDQIWDQFGTYETEPGTPLYYASLLGFHHLAARIVVECPEQVNARGGRNHSPLAAALHKRHFKVAELLHQHGAAVDIPGKRNRTPLLAASVDGSIDVVRWLLSHGADADPQDNNGLTPLLTAVGGGHLELVQALLEHDVHINGVGNNGRTPLHEASYYGHVVIAELLLKHGADVSSIEEDDFYTPLHAASGYGTYEYAEVARLLLNHGADIEAEDNRGWTPLHLASYRAAKKGGAEVVRLLLERGANVNAEDNDGRTPLHVARDLETVRFLLHHGACADAKDKEGRTPIHGVIGWRADDSEIVQMLTEHSTT